jgi:DnaJ-domain-containing protein 1
MNHSLSETWDFFRRTQPQHLEEALLEKAIHASLLDSAVTLRTNSDRAQGRTHKDPSVVLGVPPGASASVVRAAYRQRVLKV